MSDIIQLLPDSVANQIAAGEVIQRPASVIKELVENAVDAGAHTIKVVVVDAGRTSIQVVDDGCGMSETDARLAFERHATSKIRQANDLFSLTTMGFRGEALPSIAAVAQVQLTTRMATDDIGTRIVLQGTRVVSQEPVACPVGSNFKVENLFFNVPARRKFLKTNATELNNILSAFERIVLVYPAINFTLHSNGAELLNLRAGTMRQRIADVFGHKLSQDLLPVEVETALCRISGFVGKPEAARKKGGQDYFFVNGRFMKHPWFHKAVMSAFERLVPVGMQVPYFIYFNVPPSDIDVNIHPTKTEIKFENEQGIWQILSAAVKDALGRFCDIPTIDFDTEGRPDIPVFDPQHDRIEAPRVQYNPSYNPFSNHGSSRTSNLTHPTSHTAPSDWESLYKTALQGIGDVQPVQQQLPGFENNMDNGNPTLGDVGSYTGRLDAPQESLIAEKSPTHYQYKGRYVMTAVKSGLMIIDQQRADIRIRYEQYLQRLSQQQHQTQRLLFPEMLQLPPSDDVLLQQYLPHLTSLGFELQPLGGGSYAIGGVPADVDGQNPVTLMNNIVADLANDLSPLTSHLSPHLTSYQSSLALSMARHTAIEPGQVLSNDEMERLVCELFACENVNYTPDGRAILCILPQHDIEQLLG